MLLRVPELARMVEKRSAEVGAGTVGAERVGAERVGAGTENQLLDSTHSSTHQKQYSSM